MFRQEVADDLESMVMEQARKMEALEDMVKVRTSKASDSPLKDTMRPTPKHQSFITGVESQGLWSKAPDFRIRSLGASQHSAREFSGASHICR